MSGEETGRIEREMMNGNYISIGRVYSSTEVVGHTELYERYGFSEYTVYGWRVFVNTHWLGVL